MYGIVVIDNEENYARSETQGRISYEIGGELRHHFFFVIEPSEDDDEMYVRQPSEVNILP